MHPYPTSIKHSLNFAFETGQKWFIWEQKKHFTHKMTSFVKAEILQRALSIY